MPLSKLSLPYYHNVTAVIKLAECRSIFFSVPNLMSLSLIGRPQTLVLFEWKEKNLHSMPCIRLIELYFFLSIFIPIFFYFYSNNLFFPPLDRVSHFSTSFLHFFTNPVLGNTPMILPLIYSAMTGGLLLYAQLIKCGSLLKRHNFASKQCMTQR